MRVLSSQTGIFGLLVGIAAGFLMYASDLTAGIAVIGVIGTGVLLGIANRHWLIEVFSLVPAVIAGALCGLNTVVWKRDPTAHNLWPFELVMLSFLMSGLLLISGGAGVLVRRYLSIGRLTQALRRPCPAGSCRSQPSGGSWPTSSFAGPCSIRDERPVQSDIL